MQSTFRCKSKVRLGAKLEQIKHAFGSYVREGYMEEPKEIYLHLLVFMLPLRYEFVDGVL